MAVDFNWSKNSLALDVSYGYLKRDVPAPRRLNPQLVLNGSETSMLKALREELRHSSSFTFSVAFVSPGAIALLKQEILDYQGTGRIVTSDYLAFNSPAAYSELRSLANYGIDVRIHQARGFHPKGYVFEHPDHLTTIIGSSNLTENALVNNYEWNLRVSAAPESDLAGQLTDSLARELVSSDPLTEEWIAAYAEGWTPPPSRRPKPRAHFPSESVEIEPNVMQEEALQALHGARLDGDRRALVISATGTGKTILSALDVRAARPKRLLFIVHREQILDRAIAEFRRVLGGTPDEFGKLTGTSKDFEHRYLFATIQTISRPAILAKLDPVAFEYVLIDEVHRAGADSYRTVIDHFRPMFLLGLTATPERTDGFNVFELFDYNVPYEIRLDRALEADMLCPFHYYGVSDYEYEDGTTTDETTDLHRLVSSERVRHILDALERYGQAGVPPRGLIFCSRTEEARELAHALDAATLRGQVLRVVALTGADSIQRREEAVAQLESGEISYIVTVDVFNEGVDIPSVNQVIMLRQTQSSIVFVQQLGRGLRKYDGKEYLVVIDFIGNYRNNYLIPVALFGDESLNKESLRKNLIAAEEVGVVAGISSIRFDRIAQQRVLASISATRLDSFRNLKSAIETMRNRVGAAPTLWDFYRFSSVDPVILATHSSNYPTLLERALHVVSDLSEREQRLLTLLSFEALASKRLNELLVVERLLKAGNLPLSDFHSLFAGAGIPEAEAAVQSAIRVLTLEFATEMEREKYRFPAVKRVDQTLALDEGFVESYGVGGSFRVAVDDLVKTGLALNSARYDPAAPFKPGRQYTRKDAARLLNWSSNSSSTIYGYRIDGPTQTCPIFVTHEKSEEVAASTAYEDELIDISTMRYFSKSKRTLSSPDVRAIVGGEVDLHVFAKKSDAEGSGFYYLGKALAQEPEQTTMPGVSGEELPVVRMLLKFESPVEAAIYDYFKPSVTGS